MNTTKGLYIQGYSIDIKEYIAKGTLVHKKCFLVYNNEDIVVKTFYSEDIQSS
mgnify:CR=1 FL=1